MVVRQCKWASLGMSIDEIVHQLSKSEAGLMLRYKPWRVQTAGAALQEATPHYVGGGTKAHLFERRPGARC